MSDLNNSRFLKACRNEETDCTPVWFMRQAGRYMEEYRAIRAKCSMLDLIGSPQLSAEVTLQPINAFDVDAAIIFSDILPPLVGMGLSLEFVKGEGPKIGNRIESPEDVTKLVVADMRDIMGPTLEAITLVRRELEPRGIPLIGFCGAPFTLACYAIQGEGSKMYERAKSFMYNHPDSWSMLMNKLVSVLAHLLAHQVRHGASALQIFDSWAGVLSQADYARFVLPFNAALYQLVNELLGEDRVPIINFSTGTSCYLDTVAQCGGDVVSFDWRIPIDAAMTQLDGFAIQGNLDPVALMAPWDELQDQADDILEMVDGRAGHIFNLGHGILPPTPVENVKRLVDYVHEQTS